MQQQSPGRGQQRAQQPVETRYRIRDGKDGDVHGLRTSSTLAQDNLICLPDDA
jgi:hypothetical protein